MSSILGPIGTVASWADWGILLLKSKVCTMGKDLPRYRALVNIYDFDQGALERTLEALEEMGLNMQPDTIWDQESPDEPIREW